MSERVDSASLVAGLVIIAVGFVLLLDQEDVFSLSLGMTAAIAAAVIGVILVASGLAEGGNGD